MFKEALKDETLLYAKRQLPELVTADEPFVNMYVESIINKLVYEDLPRIFPIEYEDALKQILKVVASNPGITTDYSALATDLGSTERPSRNISFTWKGVSLYRNATTFQRTV